MIKYWIACGAGMAMMTTAALAQTAPSDTPNGPAGTEQIVTTHRTVDTNGGEVENTKTFSKTQSYSNDDGMLSARSVIKTNEETTVTPAPLAPAITTTTTTTTSQDVRH